MAMHILFVSWNEKLRSVFLLTMTMQDLLLTYPCCLGNSHYEWCLNSWKTEAKVSENSQKTWRGAQGGGNSAGKWSLPWDCLPSAFQAKWVSCRMGWLHWEGQRHFITSHVGESKWGKSTETPEGRKVSWTHKMQIVSCFHSSLTTQLLAYLHMSLVSASLPLVSQFLHNHNSSLQDKTLVTLH